MLKIATPQTDEETEALKAKLKSDSIIVAKKAARAAVIGTVLVVGYKLAKKYLASPTPEWSNDSEDV
jgi:hypothetical protein